MAYPDPNQPADFSGFDYSGPGAAPGPGAASAPTPGGPSAPPAPTGPDLSGLASSGQPPTSQPTSDQSLGGPGIPPAYNSFPSVRGGPVKNALTRMLYGMGQAGLAHVGLPTDYQIQQENFKNQITLAQQRVQQAHEQLLQQGQQYQESTRTVYTPYGPVQMNPRDASEYERQQVLSQQQAQQALTQKAFQPHPTIPQQLGDAMADYLGKNPGGNWMKDTSPEATKVQQLFKATQGMGKMTDTQREDTAKALEYGLDPSDPRAIVWAHNDNAADKAEQAARNTSRTQAVQGPDGKWYTMTMPGSTVPSAPRQPPPQSGGPVPAGAGAGAPLPSAGVPPTQQPGVPPAAQSRIPPNTPARQAMGGGGGGRQAVPVNMGGQPFYGKGSTKMQTWMENGRPVAGPASQAGIAQAADPTIQPADMPAADVTRMNSARQALLNLTKQGDPTKPETMGVLQLIDSLDKDGQLGVAVSRYNKLITQGVGTSPGDDPRIITLLDKNHLGATKTLQAHFGNRTGNPEIVNSFLNMANAGTMDATTLRAGSKALADYMSDNAMYPMQRGGTGGGAGPPPGAKVRDYTSLAPNTK